MKFTELDLFKLKTIEKIITESIATVTLLSDEDTKEQKIGYVEGVLDSLYSIVTLSVEEDKKILNE
jgi:hypothetical protein